MREIKFRAWDKENHKWSHDWSISEYTEILDLQAAQNYRELEYSQFTGLKDKNGKEIYDGDIVNGGYETASKENYVVAWESRYSGFEPFCLYNDDEIDYFLTDRCEVIGNIYENSDLLKDKP